VLELIKNKDMKKMKLIIGLLLITLLTYCQDDKTFTKPVTFTVPPTFSGGFYLNGILYLNMPSGGVADWNTLLNKPLTFPATTHNHDLLYRSISYVPTWAEITGKPTTFTPAAHNHDLLYKLISYVPTYAEITGKPGEIELQLAISQLKGIIPTRYTTAQINAFTLPIEEGLEVYDLTLHVKKYWNGTIWKIIITAN
jgi:hypothetical protein